jgi:hypothetical protein
MGFISALKGLMATVSISVDCQFNPIHTLPACVFRTYLDIFLPSTSLSSKQFIFFIRLQATVLCNALPDACSAVFVPMITSLC